MAEETEEVQKSGGGKGLLIVLIALIVVLILAVAGGVYFLYSQNGDDAEGAKEGKEEMAVQKADASGNAVFQADINDLVLNITNAKGREKLMKLSFSVKSTVEGIAELVEMNKAEIVDAVISQISARSSEELLTMGGKALLKEELLEEINTILNNATATNEDVPRNSVKKLFFTSFVIK